MGWSAVGFGGLWIALWSSVTLAFDGLLVCSAAWHVRALAFPTTPGTVIESRIVENVNDRDSTSHKPLIRYRYSVARNEYVGDTTRVMATTLGGERDARRQVARYPVGARVAVYYDPDRPSESVLEPGPSFFHGFLALFLTPFNIVMLGSWRVACGYVGLGWRRDLPAGASQRRTFDGHELRLYDTPPLFCGVAALLGTAFAGIFIVAFGQMILPPWPLLVLVWSAVIGVTICAYLAQRRRGRVLAINDLRGTVVLRDKLGVPDDKSDQPAEWPLADIKAVQVRRSSQSDGDGGSKETGGVLLAVRRRDGSAQRRVLVRGWSVADAEQLAAWLRERLAIVTDSLDDARRTGTQ
jgi:hypothetical protein